MYNLPSHYRKNSFDSTSTMTDLTMNSNFTQTSFSSASSLSSAFSDTASFNLTNHSRKTNNTITPTSTLHRQYQYQQQQQQQQYQQPSYQHQTSTPEYSSSHGSRTPTSPASSAYSAATANPHTVSPLFQSIPESRNVLGSLSHNYNKNAYRNQTFSSSHSAALKRHNQNLQDTTVHSVPEHAVLDRSSSSAAVPADQLQPPLQFNSLEPTSSIRSVPSEMESAKPAPKTLKPKSSWRKFKNVFNHHHNSNNNTNSNTSPQPQASPSSSFGSTSIAPQPSNVSIHSSTSGNNQIHAQLPKMKTSHHQKPSYGLVSRSDDTRLRDSEANRTEYFEAIQLKFLVYCALVSLHHLEYAKEITPSQKVLDEFSGERLRLVQHSDNIPLDSQIATIEMSLRQLREAVLTLHPSETADIFIYSAKVSSLFGNQTAYLPALTQVVSVIHPELGLDHAQFNPVFELYVLHLVHVSDAIVEVFDLLGEYTPPQNPLWDLVRAWVEKDYLRWRTYYDGETDLAKKQMMSKGELSMAREALTRIGSSYTGIPLGDLEAAIGMNWERIVDDLGCSWRKEGSTVVIKERRK